MMPPAALGAGMPAAAPMVPGAGGVPGQPPFGSSPVSQPVANRGQEAAGLSHLAVVVRLLEQTVPLLGVSSEPGQAALKALNGLAKHIPPGSVSAGLQQSVMEQLMMRQKEMAPQIAALRAAQMPPAAPPPAAA